MNKKYFTLFLILNTLYIILNPISSVFAASSFNLGVFPPIIEIIAKPKTTVKTKLRVFNYGNPISLQVYFQPFKSADQTGNIELIAPNEDKEVLDWFSLEVKDQKLAGQLNLKTKENRDLTLVLRIPKDASEADHYLTLLFASEPFGNDKITHSKMSARIGVNILLTVSDRTIIPKYGEIIEFSSPKFVEAGPVPLTLKVKNLGRTYFKPYGTIKIYNTLMKPTEEIAILPQNILGESIRALTDKSVLAVFKETDKQVLGAKDQKSEVRSQKSEKIFDLFFPKLPSSQLLTPSSPVVTFPRSFLLGRYTAIASFTLNENGPTLTAKTTFFAFPIKIASAVLVVISLLLIIRKRLKA